MAKDGYVLFSGSSHPELSERVAKILHRPLGKIKRSTFSCGEKYIALEETVRGRDVFIIQTCRDQFVNEDFMELFLICNAARLSLAEKIHVVIPHFGYARQDKVHGAREPISAKLMADLVVKGGADHVITFQLHADQERGFFDIPVDDLTIEKNFADYFREKKLGKVVIVAPDTGGTKNAKRLAGRLGAEIAILHKTRPAHNQSVVLHVIGDVKGKTCIIYDDMVDTGGTAMNARKALVDHGAKKEVYFCATHGLLSGSASKRMAKAGFREVVLTDTLPISPEKKFKGLVQVSIAPLLAEVISRVVARKSVSNLYQEPLK
jgi:ribose-phosphate pyrophosphokinase